MLTRIDWRTPLKSGKKALRSHALGPDPKAYLCGAERRVNRRLGPNSRPFMDEMPTGQTRCEACLELIQSAIV
ncbi:MAG: hypothetical protein RL095_1739 [Verrucomicrobiota bacterium]|jgi:hypothetical protein